MTRLEKGTGATQKSGLLGHLLRLREISHSLIKNN